MSELEESGRRRRAARLAELEEIELSIEKLVAGGDGLGRFEGIPIFVPRSAPGDRLRVQLTRRHPDYGRAEILEVLEPGPERREPPCPYFARCGGCDLQHLADEAQLRSKVAAARETLLRIGGLDEVPKVTVKAADPWAYRLRASLQVRPTERGVGIGFFARASHDLVPIERCPILVPEIEALLPRLPRLLRGQSLERLDVACDDDGQLTTAPVVDGLPHGEVVRRVAGLELAFDARTFFQGHHQLIDALVEHVLGPDEDGFRGREAIDLYSGVGLFSLPLGQRYSRVLAVEGDRIAVRYARTNARRNRLPGVEAVAHNVDTWVQKELPIDAERVVVDPPRAGLSRAVRGALTRALPRRITYVSCHPAALARDLKVLTRYYDVESLALLDLFPQTGHLEIVSQLRRHDEVTPRPPKPRLPTS